MSDPTQEYINANLFNLSLASNTLPTAVGSNVAWNADEFSNNFPRVENLLVKPEEFNRITVPVLFALMGKPICNSKTVTEACLAILLSMTPLDMEFNDIKAVYANRLALMEATGSHPSVSILEKLPKCKIVSIQSMNSETVADQIQVYLREMTDNESWRSGNVPSGIKELRDKFYLPTGTSFGTDCNIVAQLWDGMGAGFAFDDRGVALMAVSLYLAGVIKGLEGMKSKMSTWKFATTTFPTEKFMAEGFGPQRKLIATTLCLIDYLVSHNLFQLGSDPKGHFERFILVRFRNNRMALPSTVDAARRVLGVEMKKLLEWLLIESTEPSWNRLWRYSAIIDTGSESVKDGAPTAEDLRCLTPKKIPSFVTPYVRLYNDKCLNEFGTRGNEMLVSLCAGLGSRGGNNMDEDAWLTQLEGFQPYKSLPARVRNFIRAVVLNTKEDQMGILNRTSKYKAGRAALARMDREDAEINRERGNITNELVRTRVEFPDEGRGRSRSRSTGSNASRSSRAPLPITGRQVGRSSTFNMDEEGSEAGSD